MKKLIAIFALLLISIADAAKLPPLPSWNAKDKERMKKGELVVGVALLTKDGLKKKEEEQNNVAEIIIEAVEEKPSLEKDKKLAENSEISGEHLQRYFKGVPESTLIDPQQLLSMQERADLAYALQLHSEDSDVPIYVYLFDRGQNVPAEYEPSKMFASVFEEKSDPVVIVYYYMSAPEKSDFLLAGGASSEIPEWQVRELLWNAGLKARERSDVFDQLDVYVGQLSMRLFWIEEILAELTYVGSNESVVEEQEQAPPSQKTQEMVDTLAETVSPFIQNLMIGVGVILFSVIGGFVYVVKRKYRFPENPTPCRLGGAVGARSGGIMSYRNPQQPPTAQRKQFREKFF